MPFPSIIPDAEQFAVGARRFLDYVTPHLAPPEPAPAPLLPAGADQGAPATGEAFPSASDTSAPPPGGFDPTPPPPPPPDPMEQAAQFAAYAGPYLDDNTPPTTQDAILGGGPAQPAQMPAPAPEPAPAPSEPAFGAAGMNTYSAPIPQQGASVGGSFADEAQRFADYAGPLIGPPAPSGDPLDRYREPPAVAAPAFPIPEAIGRGIGAIGQLAGITSAVGEPQAIEARNQIAERTGMAPEEVERTFNIASMALGTGPEIVGPRAGQHVPDPRDFAAWMQYRKDLAAGRPNGPTSQQPTGMRAYEAFSKEQAVAAGEVQEALPRPALSGADAIARTDAMYAEGPTRAAAPLRQRWDNFATSFARAWTDNAADLSNVEKLAQNNLGRTLDAREMASVQSRLNPFYTARIAVDEGIRPAIADLSPRDYQDVRNILTWKGNVDVAAAKGNQARAFSGDLSAADSQAALDELARRLGPERFADLERRAFAVSDFNVDELARDVKAGLVSDAQAAEWMRQYPNYTPVLISDYLKEQGRAIGSGKSLNVQGTGYKTLSEQGTIRRRVDPIAASVDAAYQGEALRRQNISWRALHDLIQADPQMQQLFQVQKGGYTGATKYEHSVSGFIDGERWTITTPFPDIARAIRQEAGGVNVPGWNTAMTLYKELITGRNPTFLVGNAAIDAPLAILNTAMREGGAQHILPIAVDLFKGYADAFKGILSGQYTGRATSAYLKGGGGMGFYAAPSEARVFTRAGEAGPEIARLRRSSVFEVSSAADATRLARDLVTLNWVKGLGERVELGPRAMAYNRAMKRGLGADQAVLQGRTVTVDFAQGGTLSKLINSFVPFFNPAVQGVATTGRIVGQHPGGAIKTLGPALIGPTMAAEAWNRADPERSKAYDDVPDYIKDRGVVVMLPGQPPTDEKGETRPQFITINLRQLAPVATMTREVYDRVVGADDHRTAASLLQGAAQQVSPVSGFGQMLPPFITTGAELGINKDIYRGTDIATRRTDERASALGAGAAAGVNAAFGTRVRPSQAEYAIRDTAGGVGEMATGASDILAGRTKQSGAPQDIPVAGGFVRRVLRGDVGQELQDARANRLSPGVRAMLDAAGITYDPSLVRAEVNHVPLRRQEETRFQEAVNRYTEERLQGLLRSETFGQLPAARREALVKQQVATARRQAAGELLAGLGEEEVRRRLEAQRP